jgi:hypothetical protein
VGVALSDGFGSYSGDYLASQLIVGDFLSDFSAALREHGVYTMDQGKLTLVNIHHDFLKVMGRIAQGRVPIRSLPGGTFSGLCLRPQVTSDAVTLLASCLSLGDTRIYQDSILLSRDHTYAQEYIDALPKQERTPERMLELYKRWGSAMDIGHGIGAANLYDPRASTFYINPSPTVDFIDSRLVCAEKGNTLTLLSDGAWLRIWEKLGPLEQSLQQISHMSVDEIAKLLLAADDHATMVQLHIEEIRRK